MIFIDCLSDLVGAVLHAFTAIESLANHSIDQLPDDATVDIERQGETVTVAKGDMVRRLSITESRGSGSSISSASATTSCTSRSAGTRPTPDPSVYGKLLLGAGDDCVEEATSLVQAARPIFLPDPSSRLWALRASAVVAAPAMHRSPLLLPRP